MLFEGRIETSRLKNCFASTRLSAGFLSRELVPLNGVWSVALSRNKKTMNPFEVIDTFPAFLAYWAEAHNKPTDNQIELWETNYMSGWTELLEKQIEDYSEQSVDWKQIARERVFPYLGDRLPAMREARENLLKLCPAIYSKAEQVLGFHTSAYFVIYVGIGCGAGWVTTFRDKYSILFGLENIAESGWSDPESITGLICHEMGHVAHYHLRAQNKRRFGSDAWWQLYTEGFAQHCESLINESSHQETQDDDWLEWCQQNKSRLAADFIRAVDEEQPVNAFFGSWFEIEGHSETGYFLGHEVIKGLVKKMSFHEIALLDDFDKQSRRILEGMKKKD